MQCFAVSLFVFHILAVSAAISKNAAKRGGTILTTHDQAEESVRYTPQDIFECSSVASKFLQGPTSKVRAQEKALDFCMSHNVWVTDYTCTYFRDGLADAFDEAPEDKEFTPETFCKVAEQYMLDMRGATRVPDMGFGTIYNFQVTSSCASAISGAISPDTSLETPGLANLMYDECANPGCAHRVPSRNRPCEPSRPPTHTNAVCEALWKFAGHWAEESNEEKLNATAICDVYAQFVWNRGYVVRSYQHIMHEKGVHHIPVPTDPAWSLQTSLLLNGVTSRFLRDNAGGIHHVMSAGIAPTPCQLLVVSLLSLAMSALW